MSQRQLQRHEGMHNLLVGLHDPRFRDTILRGFPGAEIVYVGPRTVSEHIPRYATVCIREGIEQVHVSARSVTDFEVNPDWEVVAVYDLESGEMVAGTAFEDRDDDSQV